MKKINERGKNERKQRNEGKMRRRRYVTERRKEKRNKRGK